MTSTTETCNHTTHASFFRQTTTHIVARLGADNRLLDQHGYRLGEYRLLDHNRVVVLVDGQLYAGMVVQHD
jgi:hypothetical protein